MKKSSDLKHDDKGKSSFLVNMLCEDSLHTISILAKRLIKKPLEIDSIFMWFIAFRGASKVPYDYILSKTQLVENIIEILPHIDEVFANPKNLANFLGVISFLTSESCPEIEAFYDDAFFALLINLFEKNNENVTKNILIIFAQLMTDKPDIIENIAASGLFTVVPRFLSCEDFYVKNMAIYSMFFGFETTLPNAIQSFATLIRDASVDFTKKATMVKGLEKLCGNENFPPLLIENSFCELLVSFEPCDVPGYLSFVEACASFYKALLCAVDDSLYGAFYQQGALQSILAILAALHEGCNEPFYIVALEFVFSASCIGFSQFDSDIFSSAVLELLFGLDGVSNQRVGRLVTLILCSGMLKKQPPLSSTIATTDGIVANIVSSIVGLNAEDKCFVINALIALCETNTEYVDIVQTADAGEVFEELTESGDNEELCNVALSLIDLFN